MSEGRGLPRRARRLLTAIVVVGLIAGFVTFLYQRPIAQWGSTASERSAPMAGDGVVAGADIQWTRSITIDAPPSAVWPWLVQMGVDKCGFYNYDWGEQIAGLDPVHNATAIHPGWQDLRVGGAVHPMPGSDWRVVTLEPNRVLVLDNPAVSPTDWSWATELRPIGAGDRTRLVTRIRNHKGSVFSYALDAPDLILFPRLLTGLKQRAEGTLPGMPGTHTGRPFPLARLPVHWWAGLAWLVGLAAAGWLLAPMAGLGRWERRRPHPWIIVAAGFVAGAGYLLMSDTPPLHFLRHVWALGIAAGMAAGVALARRRVARAVEDADVSARWLPRALVAVVETGLFIVVPVTAVWQAATAQGWTASLAGRLAVSALAAAIATAIAGAVWSRSLPYRSAFFVAAVLAVAYAATGSGLAALSAAVIAETSPARATTSSAAFETVPPDRELVGAR